MRLVTLSTSGRLGLIRRLLAKNLRSALDRYKHSYKRHFRRDTEHISPGDYLFLHLEKKGHSSSGFELAPLAESRQNR